MGLLFFLIFGFIVGLLARAIMPGRQHMGIVMTTVLGIVGSFIGGFLGSLFSANAVTDLHPAGLIGSIIGALVVLAIAHGVFGSRRHRFV